MGLDEVDGGGASENTTHTQVESKLDAKIQVCTYMGRGVVELRKMGNSTSASPSEPSPRYGPSEPSSQIFLCVNC